MSRDNGGMSAAGIGDPCRAARTAATTAGIDRRVGANPGRGVGAYGERIGSGPVGPASDAVVFAMDWRLNIATSMTSPREVPHSTPLVLIGRRRVACLIGFSIARKLTTDSRNAPASRSRLAPRDMPCPA